MATRKFKQTNTPTPSPPLPAPLSQKLCGRMRRADPGGEAGRWRRARGTRPEQGPRPRTGDRGPSFWAGRLRSGFLFRIYIFILSLALRSPPSLPPPHSSPRLSPDHTRYSLAHELAHPRPPEDGGGKKVPLGFRGLKGGDSG